LILQAERINKSFEYGKKVLNEVNFSISEKEVFVLCGRSGAGKTSLIKIISGLLSFDSGLLRIGDKFAISANDQYPKELFGKIGVIFQEHNLFPHMTALQNVALALHSVQNNTKSEANEIAMQYLRQVRMEDKSKSFPSNLSGGEKQRVSIARALALKPYFLLLDEPTSHLDPLLIDDIFEIIDELASKHKTTMLLSTHNLNFAKHIADKFAVLQDGTLTVSEDAGILATLEGKWN
jgi:polar amino acid transport system ATP-binding protein